MPWIAPAIIGGSSLLSGALGADAASSAANAQAKASDLSIAEQRRQYDQTRADNAPFRQTGVAANRRLSQLLGLSTGSVDTTDPRYLAIRNELAKSSAPAGAAPAQTNGAEDTAFTRAFGPTLSAIIGRVDPSSSAGAAASAPGLTSQQLDDQASQQFLSQYGNTDASAPGYGSLLNKFTSTDLNADPVYQSGLKFGLDQGTDAINARATQAGNYDSGATLKALTRFGNDYGSTKANDSFNRFNATNDSTYNKLTGVSGSGQVATNQVNAAGANMAGNVSNSLEGAGNARAAGIVGGANAWGGAASGINGAVNNYQNNQILQQLLKKNSGGGATFTPSEIYAG